MSSVDWARVRADFPLLQREVLDVLGDAALVESIDRHLQRAMDALA